MRYTKVCIAGFGYELAPNVVSSDDLEKRLIKLYDSLHLQPGQLQALTGIAERRFWDPDMRISAGAVLAGKKALAATGIQPHEIGMLIYAGVCRENLEPATACAVADRLGIKAEAEIYDVSNACLGVLNGMVQIANAIELGQIRAGMVVSCESARQIVETTVRRLLETNSMAVFKETIATLTGGSGAVAVVLSEASRCEHGHRLLGGLTRNATRYHQLCTWGPDTGIPASLAHVMRTDSVGVLKHGVALGIETYRAFKLELDWPADKPDKVICHQVGSVHQRTILESIGIDPSKDFSTYRYLGNIGTVSLPITAAIAEERQFLQAGDLVAFLGIGSGLNCLMLGIRW
ncbi:MAG: 3-oxoacyl-ACP synthase III [Desulfobacteraceae bacterium]|nr:MAG: 3-oxoacyl-ACP synthase III [Desulfobacteraceae bacterium]